MLQLKELEQNKLSNEQVFVALRSKRVFDLGKVKRLYLEACGLFSVYRQEEPRPGLSIYPNRDEKIFEEKIANGPDEKACCCCGPVQAKETAVCINCGRNEWAKAVL